MVSPDYNCTFGKSQFQFQYVVSIPAGIDYGLRQLIMMTAPTLLPSLPIQKDNMNYKL